MAPKRSRKNTALAHMMSRPVREMDTDAVKEAEEFVAQISRIPSMCGEDTEAVLRKLPSIRALLDTVQVSQDIAARRRG